MSSLSISVMAYAILFFCASALWGRNAQAETVSPQSLVSISHVGCSSATGGRAIISEDGQSFAIQCDGKTVKLWSEGSHQLVGRESVSLFLAARRGSMIPSRWRCPTLEMHEKPLTFDIRFSDVNDCDVVDHSEDNASYIVSTGASAYVVTPLREGTSKPSVYTAGLLESLRMKSQGYRSLPMPILDGGRLEVRSSPTKGGVLLPRRGLPTEIVIPTVNGYGLEALALDGHGIRQVSKFEMPLGLPWEDTDSQADNLYYSTAHKLLIVQCVGIFRFYRGDMTYVRAYSLDGVEQWTIRKPIQVSGEYAMGSASVLLFGDGRFAAVGYWNRGKDVSSKPTFDIVDIEDGTTLASFDGWPIATSARANRVVVENASKDFDLIDYTPLVDPFVNKNVVEKVIRRFKHMVN
jgi:hypothetical protein